jgi:hypothetical protein
MGFSTKTWINDLQKFDKNVFSAIDADIFKLKDPKDSIVLTDDYLNNVKQTDSKEKGFLKDRIKNITQTQSC